MSATHTAPKRLRLAMVFGQAVIAEHMLEGAQKAVLGFGEEAVLPLPEAQAARGDHTLLTPLEGGGFALSLPADARGALWLSGVRRDVHELVLTSPNLTLRDGDYGVVSLGAASYFFQQVAPAEPPTRRLLASDGDLSLAMGLSWFIHVCLLLLMLLAQYHFPVDTSLDVPPELVTRFVVNPPVENPFEGGKKAGDQKEAGKDKGEEGKPEKNERRERPAPAPATRSTNTSAVAQKVRGLGVLGALSGGDALASALNVKSVSSLLGGIGDLRTDAGLGGRPGLRATGSGGGGNGSGLLGGGGLGAGLGAGGAGGSGSGAGAGAGAGKGRGRAESKVELTPGTPQVSGYLSAEQINRVVRANQAALRYCYESEVQRQRSLRGKVIVQWRVDLSGGVPTARVASTTLNDARVEGCIVRQVRKWRFPKPDGGEVSVMYPFIFGVGG